MKKLLILPLLLFSFAASAQFSIDSVTVYHNNFSVDSINVKGKTKIPEIDRIFTFSYNDACGQTPFSIIFRGCTTSTVTTFDTTYSFLPWTNYSKTMYIATAWDTSSTCAYPLVQTVTDTLIWDYCFTTGVEEKEEETEEQITIYPNPVNNRFFIENSSELSVKSLIIYDLRGKQVLTKIIQSNEIDVSILPNGLYFLVLKVGEKQLKRKIVVQH